MRIKKKTILNLFEDVNFHYGNYPETNKQLPEYSDNIFIMSGRGTGHFGSGMYFSTYNKEKELDKYRDKKTDGLEKLGDSLVSIDLDEIPNMFKVKNSRMGEFLFNTLKLINNSFYAFISKIDRSENNYNKFKSWWFKIYRNISDRFNRMGVDFPPIDKCEPLLKQALKDYLNGYENASRSGSFSTRVMTFLGFNGVDVSGVQGYDNTTHGSVVYDIFNYKSLVHKIDPTKLKTPSNFEDLNTNSFENTIQLNKLTDFRARAYFSNLQDVDIEYNLFELLSQRNKRLYLKRLIHLLKSGEYQFSRQTPEWIVLVYFKYFNIPEGYYINEKKAMNYFSNSIIKKFITYCYIEKILSIEDIEAYYFNFFDKHNVIEYGVPDEINYKRIKEFLLN